MPKKVPEGRRFKPGQSGNPHGGRLHNPMYKALKKITQQDVADIMQWVGEASAEELKKAVMDPNTPSLKLLIAKCYSIAVNKGDTQAMERLLTRMIGPVKQVVELKNPEGETFRTEDMSKNAIEKELAEIEKRRREREAE